jgi:hypothetical protein
MKLLPLSFALMIFTLPAFARPEAGGPIPGKTAILFAVVETRAGADPSADESPKVLNVCRKGCDGSGKRLIRSEPVGRCADRARPAALTSITACPTGDGYVWRWLCVQDCTGSQGDACQGNRAFPGRYQDGQQENTA